MQIIAHRGYWLSEQEKNTPAAFIRALKYGFGIELDLRDMNGLLVISHDIPTYGAMKAQEFIDLYRIMPISSTMAFNIKSDGLYALIKDLIFKSGITNYFVFDMSIPDTKKYLLENIPVFTRLSEYETPVFFDQSSGVWLDAFESQWYEEIVIKNLLSKEKRVAVVSPELHRRPHLELWQFLKANNFHLNNLISLCTDFPLEAREYFNA
jgi:hypothetical protein